MPSSNLISVVCPHCQHHHYCVREDTYNDTDRVVQKATVTQSRRPSPKPPVPLRQTEVVYPRYNIAPQTSPSSGYYAPNHKWVEYDLYIPGYLQPATRVAIMNKMQERPSVSDRSGYIYAFAIEGVKSPQRFQIKVGRESKVGQRLGSYWSKHYRDFSPRLIFPTEKMKSIGVPAYKKVERLALLVMADLAQHKAYLDPDSMKAGIPPSPRAKGSKEPCLVAGCNTNHIEIFSFDSDANSQYFAKEEVVRMIEKWIEFSIKFD